LGLPVSHIGKTLNILHDDDDDDDDDDDNNNNNIVTY
jgi:hypothetical protein